MVRLAILLLTFTLVSSFAIWYTATHNLPFKTPFNSGVSRPSPNTEETLNIAPKPTVAPTIESIIESSPSAEVETDLTVLGNDVVDLQKRVTKIEKNTPKKPPLYIPLVSTDSSNDRNWFSLDTLSIQINADDYPGYSGIQLEASLKLAEVVGIGSARIYNDSDSVSLVGSDISTTAASYSFLTSSSFRLVSGQRTYRLQLKSSEGYDLFVQNARLKISF